MDVFALRDQLIDDYKSFVTSFIQIRDEKIKAHVDHLLTQGEMWPSPLVQINPFFASGGSVKELVQQHILHPTCAQIFPINLYKHQETAIKTAQTQKPYVVTTGTGSGKSLTYIIPIVDAILKEKADAIKKNAYKPRVRAIVVYPMNALANSQAGELHKFLDNLPKSAAHHHGMHVSFARYTGQESEAEREGILDKPPDILLTNYVMLELILTRVKEQRLRQHADQLRFLVFDELHTYRGRQGADVAWLIRRVRTQLHADALQCIGTSATMASEGSRADRFATIARVATQIFGDTVPPEHVIGETLVRATQPISLADLEKNDDIKTELKNTVTKYHQKAPAFTTVEAFLQDPLSRWIESRLGIKDEPDPQSPTGFTLERCIPRNIDEAAALLLHDIQPQENNQHNQAQCARAIQNLLLSAYAIPTETTQKNDDKKGSHKKPFAFRLHQFIARGDTVYATLEARAQRYITHEGQLFAPHETTRKRLYPLIFCRDCGQEYYTVKWRKNEDGRDVLEPRSAYDTQVEDENQKIGFLYANEIEENDDKAWPSVANYRDYTVSSSLGKTALERLPEDWLEETSKGLQLRSSRKEHVPHNLFVDVDGNLDLSPASHKQTAFASAAPTRRWTWVGAPFRFCLRCASAYSAQQRSDFEKLGTLGSEGRSTATTILSISALRTLQKQDNLPRQAQKLLSFTDNRQDASLQAGHFNDFIDVALLRAALYKACQACPAGIKYDELTHRVFAALDLPFAAFAAQTDIKLSSARQTVEETLRDVIGYRLYRDLRRGWRITSPNLEQCDLLRIIYPTLDEVVHTSVIWLDKHQLLQDLTPAQKKQLCKDLLDVLRRNLAIKVPFLDANEQEKLRQRSAQHLIDPWALERDGGGEKLERAVWAHPYSRPTGEKGEHNLFDVYISGRSAFGKYVKRALANPAVVLGSVENAAQAQQEAHNDSDENASDINTNLKYDEITDVIKDLFRALAEGGILSRDESSKNNTRRTRSKNIKSKGNNDTDDTPAPDTSAYQLLSSAMYWTVGDGTQSQRDPLRRVRVSDAGKQKTNTFFVNFYRHVADQLRWMRAGEHTAQVPSAIREEREQAFRGTQLANNEHIKLPLLFCSPTMELGVDISDLNVVNLRNVPPTPANYAQRSGRAGRSGQPALVFTYCSSGSPHDQHFFRKPADMVAGAVREPRLDLANEDLMRAHIQAIWLTESGVDLKTTLRDVVDVGREKLPVVASIAAAFDDKNAFEMSRALAKKILSSPSMQRALQESQWFFGHELDTATDAFDAAVESAIDTWLSTTLRTLQSRFEESCNRWRMLYLSAQMQQEIQYKISCDPLRSEEERREADRLRGEARRQIELLLAENKREQVQSDFYSYRYFAAEGFLPGYNFPRLPLSAYLPGQRGNQDDAISRPRFLAISEFGPRALIYHEGARFQINRVILPADGSSVGQTKGKICQTCGAMHIVTASDDIDLCKRCNSTVDVVDNLFRMQNVVTKRRDRISCDEEERTRLGYDLATTYDLGPNTQNHILVTKQAGIVEGNGVAAASASISSVETTTTATLSYGHAATLWRINWGWRRRKEKEANKSGFWLDTERGFWKKGDWEEDGVDDRLSNAIKLVVPYAEDRRNTLIFEPSADALQKVLLQPVVGIDPSLSIAQREKRIRLQFFSSLQAALKNAIQTVFQLEDNEIACERLPSKGLPRSLLFYEATEGGAGALRQLVSSMEMIHKVARTALELCHFDVNFLMKSIDDPAQKQPIGVVPSREKACTAACYSCLMSYFNQREHQYLDRQVVVAYLLDLLRSTGAASPSAKPRSNHFADLLAQCQSELEREWLQLLQSHGHILPTHAQKLLEINGQPCRPDFYYQDRGFAIYIDGPHHDAADRAARDQRTDDALLDAGLCPLRFAYHEERGAWLARFAEYPTVFGPASRPIS